MPRVLSTAKVVWCVAGGTLLLFGCGHRGDEAGKNLPIPVIVTKAEKRAVTLSLRAVGNVESINTVAIVPRVDGQISKVFVQDGQNVKRNQPLFQIDTAPLQIQLRAAQATFARDQAKLDNARVRAEHGRAVLADHYISPDDYTQLKTDFDSAQATVDADLAARDNAALQLEYATIRAPVDGKLGHIAMQTGNMVHANSVTPLTTLNVLDPIDVTFAVPEQNIDSLRLARRAGTEVRVTTADNTNAIVSKHAEWVGKLTFIDNSVDAATGTIRLRARFDNSDRILWPGEFVTTTLPLSSEADSIVVPNVAIQQGPSGAYVFVIKDSAAEQRSIQVLKTTETDSAVAGVAEGEQIVTDGQSRLNPGSTVSLQQRQRLAGGSSQ